MENNENRVGLNVEELEEVSGGKGGSGNFVKATGDVYVRTKPDKESKALGILSAGTTVSYLGSTKKDSRGVAWYKVNYNGNVGWVSSKYSKRVN